MAIEKNIKTKHEVDAKFWKLTCLEICSGDDVGKINCTYSGWADKTAKDVGGAPLEKVTFTIDESLKNDLDALEKQIMKEKIDNKKFFAGSKQVAE